MSAPNTEPHGPVVARRVESLSQVHDALDGSSARAWVRSPLAVPLVAAVLLALHFGLGHPSFSALAHVGAASIGILAFLILREATPSRLPFIPLVAVQTYIFFATPTLSEQRLAGAHGPIFVTNDSRTTAVWAAALMLGMIFVAAGAGRRIGERIQPIFERFTPPGGVLRLRGAIRLWSIATLAVRATLMLGFGGMQGSPYAFILGVVASTVIAQALLFEEWRASRSPLSRVWFWGFTLASVLLGLGSGMLQDVLTPLVGAIVLQWLATGKFRLRYLVILLFAYFVLAPAKYHYRRETWNPFGRSSTQVTLTERAQAWVGAIEETWGGDQPAVSENVDTGTGRFSALMYAAQSFDWVPAFVPFTGPSRWAMIVYAYVPRFMWRAKPDMTKYHNANYAVAFDLLSEPGTRTTAVGFFLITDGYWALGWPGIFIAAMLVGFLLGVYEGLFVPRSWAGTAVGFAFLMSVQGITHLGSVYGGVLQGIFAFVVALWVIWIVAFVITERRPFAKARPGSEQRVRGLS